MLDLLAGFLVAAYDVALRCAMPSYYLLLHAPHGSHASSLGQHLAERADKKTRRYLEACCNKFGSSLSSGDIEVPVV